MVRHGDIQLIENGDNYLLIACDSAGAIGNKPEDIVQVDPETVGFYTAIVPVIEILAARGKMISIVNTLSVEMHPTGERIINGIYRLMGHIGMSTDLLTGSTEENMSTVMTGVGVTVIGSISTERHHQKSLNQGDQLILMGYPKVGSNFLKDEVIGHKHECVTIDDVLKMKNLQEIKDMIPVGSKGIEYECRILSDRYGLKFQSVNHPVDMFQSAGPATCIVAGVEPSSIDQMKQLLSPLPITLLGGLL